MRVGGWRWRELALVWAGALVVGACGSSGSGGQGGGGTPGAAGGGGGRAEGGTAGGVGTTGAGGAGIGGLGVGGAAGGGVTGGGGNPVGAAGLSGGVSTGGGGVAGGGGGGTTGGAGTGVTGAAGAGAGGAPGSCGFTSTTGIWSEITARPADAGLTVTDSFALGADDILFAGVTAAGAAGNQLRVVRFTNGCWTQELSVPIDASAPSASVHGTGPGDLWAVGGAVIMHGTGQSWTVSDSSWMSKVQLSPRIVGAPAMATLVRVRAVSATDVWFNEWENVLHWLGGTWTGYDFDSPDYPASAAYAFRFHDIWIDAASSIWVSYGSDQIGNTMSGAGVQHFDGTNWTPWGTGVYDMFDIWRSGSTLWLAGGAQFSGTLIPFSGTNSPFPQPIQIQGVPMSSNSVAVSSLWGRADDDIWAGGTDVVRFDGTNWTLQTDTPAAAHSTTNDSSNTLVGGDPAATWLVTPGPRFFRRPAP